MVVVFLTENIETKKNIKFCCFLFGFVVVDNSVEIDETFEFTQ